jgi:hypothetical protein
MSINHLLRYQHKRDVERWKRYERNNRLAWIFLVIIPAATVVGTVVACVWIKYF